MSAPLPKTKLEEIAEVFANESIKIDLKPFGEGSRLIAKYRKSMNDLIQSDPYEAYMGLGILGSYEGNYANAISYFKAAERLNPISRSPKINLSTCVLLAGNLDGCIDLLIQYIDSYQDDKVMLGICLRVFHMFYYFDELENLRQKNINNTLFNEVFLKSKDDTPETEVFMSQTNLDKNVLRAMQLLATQEFFSRFSINSSFTSNYTTYLNADMLSEIIYIPKKLFGDMYLDNIHIIDEMNNSLQEKLTDLFFHYSYQDNSDSLLNSFRSFSIYFALDERVKKN